MIPHATPIDITNIPELSRITREVEASGKPLELRRDNKVVAVIMPAALAIPRKKRKKAEADYEAFRSAAGSWKDVDVEAFKAAIYTSRRLSTKPPVNL